MAAPPNSSWKNIIFKNRGLLLLPVAIVLIIFGRPSLESAIVGVSVALVGEALRIWAVGYSGVTTRANVVTAPALVTGGPYSRLRNPLYVGNAITALGFWIAFSGKLPLQQSALLLAVVLLAICTVYGVIIPLEETFLQAQFGDAYLRYRQKVPRIVPSGKPLAPNERVGRWRAEVIARAEVITFLYLALMVAAVVVKLRLP